MDEGGGVKVRDEVGWIGKSNFFVTIRFYAFNLYKLFSFLFWLFKHQIILNFFFCHCYFLAFFFCLSSINKYYTEYISLFASPSPSPSANRLYSNNWHPNNNQTTTIFNNSPEFFPSKNKKKIFFFTLQFNCS